MMNENGDLTIKGAWRLFVNSLPTIVILGPVMTGLLYVVVAPSVAQIVQARAPVLISECFDKSDFDLGLEQGFKGKCSEIVETIVGQAVPMVVADQVDTRFQKLETDVTDLKSTVAEAGGIARSNQQTLEELKRAQVEAQRVQAREFKKILDAIQK